MTAPQLSVDTVKESVPTNIITNSSKNVNIATIMYFVLRSF